MRSPSAPARQQFGDRALAHDPEPAMLSREWIEELANSANSSGGIMLVAEHFGAEQVLPADQA